MRRNSTRSVPQEHSPQLQYLVVGYMKQALTGQEGDTPAVYRYWTEIFTRALQRQLISGREIYLNFQRFLYLAK